MDYYNFSSIINLYNFSIKKENSMKKGIGKSHSKIILIGEHSVVYGYPAIAIPLKKIGIECIVEEAKSSYFHKCLYLQLQDMHRDLSQCMKIPCSL